MGELPATPWSVHRAPGPRGPWIVTDASGNEIVDHWSEDVARLVAAAPDLQEQNAQILEAARKEGRALRDGLREQLRALRARYAADDGFHPADEKGWVIPFLNQGMVLADLDKLLEGR